MITEILATGDELRTGALVDSNSAYIADALEAIGMQVVRHTTVGDDLPALVSILIEIGGRAQFCVVTGGLGPTVDDLSSEVAAAAAGVGCRFHEAALKNIEAFFSRIGRSMSPSNRKQAFLPESADILDNPVGTAPGFAITIGGCRFCFLPGVPREMKRMMKDHILPLARRLLGPNSPESRIRTITTFGLTESAVDDRLKGFGERHPRIKLGMRAKFPEIQVKFYARGTVPAQLEKDLAAAEGDVARLLGTHVISLQGESMAALVGRRLREAGKTIALAESCTGGLLADMVTEVPGSSDYFLFSGVTYSNEAKMTVLKVRPETLQGYGAVHEQTVMEMAAGARAVSGADYGLSTSGIAGPGGGTPEKPVGTVCIGLAGPDFVAARRYHFKYGIRERNKRVFAMKALDLLRLTLETGSMPER